MIAPTLHLDQLIDEMAQPGRGYANVMQDLETQILRRALDRHLGNRNRTADSLKLNRTTLVEKLKKLGLIEYMRYGKVEVVL